MRLSLGALVLPLKIMPPLPPPVEAAAACELTKVPRYRNSELVCEGL